MKELIFGLWMLVGTYTGSGSEGIYVYKVDPRAGQIEQVGVTEVDNPSYLAVSADGRTVWAVSENDGESFVNALSFDLRTGALEPIDRERVSGAAPCNVTTNGRVVVTANYGGGDVSVFGIEDGGGLTSLRRRLMLPSTDKPSHMHCVKFSPDGRFLFAADLGTDKIVRWRVGRDGYPRENSMKTFDLPAGSGPRHFVFDGAGRHMYLINELSGTVMTFGYKKGELSLLQTLQADRSDGHGSADVVSTPDGRHVYTSHRLKNDGVAIFDVSSGDGTLIPAGYRNTAVHPRNLNVTPDGRFLTVAARDGGTVEFFEIERSNGQITPRPGMTISLDKPVCVTFIAAE